MADRIEDEREALTAMSHTPPRKAASLRHSGPTTSAVPVGRRVSKTRNHSLDDERLASMAMSIHHNHIRDNSTDEDYYHSSGAGATANSGDGHTPRYDHSISLPTPAGNCSPVGNNEEALPEFTASGSTGIFKAPGRAAVHPNRPAPLELRPHPLRETQTGRFLKTIGCTDTQLWAGQESGVRFWKFDEAYEPGCGIGGRVRRGDEDAAPFYESANTPLTNCLIVDQGNRLVWTGHKDGKIRSWKMDQDLSEAAMPFREGLSWNAHKGPVLSLAISSYGDIWSGSENGMIKMWTWESIEKPLSLSPEERHMAALLVERANIDLKSQVTVNGVCNISSSDVKIILSDHARGRMWCATSMSFSLWDARTRELIKVFNIDGHIENRVEMPVPQDQAVEDEVKVKSGSKKDKPQGFLQRSRNAIMGAADAVRRVASRSTGAFNEDCKKTEAMVLTSDGTIWSGCSNGLLVQWDANGNRLQDFNHHPTSVLCFCAHGARLWVGYATGVVQLLDVEGNLIAGWVAHSSPVIKMSIGGGYVYSLATHGGIRGWGIMAPGPIDNILRTELASRESLYMRRESFKILVGTWNVGQGKPPHDSLRSWLGSAVSDVGIVVVGLQEVEMGAGFLAMSAAKETVGLEGSAIGNQWQDAIGKALDEGPVFERVGSRQLAGLLIAIWVRKNLRMHVGDLDVAAVACGLGRTIGNKGGVGLRLRVHDRIICFVNCHLAAHLEAVNRRNADFDHIFRSMVFSRQTNVLNVAAGNAGGTATQQTTKTSNTSNKENTEEGRPELAEADMVVFTGDFNYRLFGISYDEARDLVSQRSFDWLREKDQLRAEMKAGKVFQGMREAVIRFTPTYKFERHKPGLGGYDSGEKKRIPAWCDRVIYRDCRSGPGVTECTLDSPVISSVLMYEACMDVTDSDHKPVRCKLSVRAARADRSIRRKEYGVIIKTNDRVKSLLQESYEVPETEVNTESITLQNQEICPLHITNKSRKENAAFCIICEGIFTVNEGGELSELQTRGSFGFPSWLEVNPACGIIRPEQTTEVIVRHAESQGSGDGGDSVPQNSWSEDTRDREVVLSVQVTCSTSMHTRTHTIRVRYHYSAKASRIESRTNSTRMGNPNESQHRRPDNSDMVDRG